MMGEDEKREYISLCVAEVKYKKLKEAINEIKEIFEQKSQSDDWEYIHDLQIWEDALDILSKKTEGLV